MHVAAHLPALSHCRDLQESCNTFQLQLLRLHLGAGVQKLLSVRPGAKTPKALKNS